MQTTLLKKLWLTKKIWLFWIYAIKSTPIALGFKYKISKLNLSNIITKYKTIIQNLLFPQFWKNSSQLWVKYGYQLTWLTLILKLVEQTFWRIKSKLQICKIFLMFLLTLIKFFLKTTDAILKTKLLSSKFMFQ